MPRREYFCVAALLVLGACRGGGREPAIGEGFVVASELNLHQDLGIGQPVVAVARHGERLEILARRRRFVRARTASGATGWTDGNLLFSLEEMEQLRSLGRWASARPPQGQATVFEPLNVHTSPARGAPTFQQIREGQSVAVVGHKLVSADDRSEDWSLVVLPEAVAGWVLTRRLFMSVPDEVAQYAEGRRIMAYFPVGEVRHGEQVKRNWLWATIARGGQPFEFDSLRLFVWSLRRNRYETAFMTRNLKGYYPIEVSPEEPRGAYRFTFVAHEKDGPPLRLTYVFEGQRVRLVSRTPVSERPPAEPPVTVAPAASEPPAGFFRRWKQGLTGFFRKRSSR